LRDDGRLVVFFREEAFLRTGGLRRGGLRDAVRFAAFLLAGAFLRAGLRALVFLRVLVFLRGVFFAVALSDFDPFADAM
jgi:hypothetical protein